MDKELSQSPAHVCSIFACHRLFEEQITALSWLQRASMNACNVLFSQVLGTAKDAALVVIAVMFLQEKVRVFGCMECERGGGGNGVWRA